MKVRTDGGGYYRESKHMVSRKLVDSKFLRNTTVKKESVTLG